MKKLVALAMILAVVAPSMAGTTVTVVQPVQSVAQFNVNYAFDGTGSAPRAFALDVTTNLGTFTAVVAAKTGESVVGSLGYGIFPGTIIIDSTGSVTNIGSPVAQHGDLPSGTLSDLPAAGITLELGSLYATTAAKPAVSGTLVTVDLSGLTVGGATATISIVPNTARGGVVLEDATSLAAFTATGNVFLPAPALCFDSTLSTFARWTLSGSPACWCPPTSVTGFATGGTGYQCVGDAAQDTTGTLRVYTADLNLVTTNWKRTLTTPGYNACADVAHDTTGTLAVYTSDLNRVTTMWKKTNAQLNTILGVGGTGGYCGQATVPTSYK